MSGRPTWAGWITLDDTASWLAFTDWVMSSGRTVPAEVTSTFERLIDVNLGGASAAPYPTGAFPPLGVMGAITGVDIAWLFHPFMCLLGGLLALSLYRTLDDRVPQRPVRAASAVVASVAATLFGYVLWGGVKEVLLALLLIVTATAAAEAAGRTAPRRAVVPALLGAVAFLSVSGASGLGYVVPLLGGAVLVAWVRRRPRSGAVAVASAVSAGLTVALALAAGLVPQRLSPVPEIPDDGNLVGPLNPAQALGIWITGDFRFGPDQPVVTWVLIVLAALLAAVGLVAAIRAGSWTLPLAALPALIVAGYSQVYGGAWLAGKAIAVASPILLACAFGGLAAIAARIPRTRATSLGLAFGYAALAVGVLWSDVLAYRSVWLAPTSSQAELAAIGREFAGRGPALMTDFSVFGGRHFLRALDTEVAAELRVNPIPLRDGSIGEKGESFDISAFPPSTLAGYPVLVLRRSPVGTRPPAEYSLARPGRFYDVWVRNSQGEPAPDVPLSGPFALTGDLACRAISALPAAEGLVASPRLTPLVVPLDSGELPDGWTSAEGFPGAVIPKGAGLLTGTVELSAAGEYEVWLAGSSPGTVNVSVGDQRLSQSGVLEGDPAAVTSLGRVTLEAGVQPLEVSYDAPWWRPGTAAGPLPMGPVYLTSAADDPGVVAVESASAACGDLSRWEWVSGRPAAAGSTPTG
jgi:hypothetical protein